MATEKQSHLNNQMPELKRHPAYLWVGRHEELINTVKKSLQHIMCTQNGCKSCVTCNQIEEKQHYNFLWLQPEKQYVLDDLTPVFKTISFALESDQHFFFIIEKADLLNQACCNSLLKIMEEPPAGYHFLLLTQRIDSILPTIRSRCLITRWHANIQSIKTHPLASCFTSFSLPEPATFLQTLDQVNPHDQESLELIDALLDHWIEKYTQYVKDNNTVQVQHTIHVIEILKKGLQQPPMPGSSKIFWKNIYVQIGI